MTAAAIHEKLITDEKLWRDLDAANSGSPELEERSADVVAGHLVWAGFDLKRARVVVDGRVVAGWLHTPDLDLAVIGFTPHRRVDAPEQGASLRVAYGRGVDGYIFESALQAEDDGTWLLELPTAIGARGQRLTGRTLACGAWFLRLDDEDETEIELHDLSVSGVSLLVAPDEDEPEEGRRLSGWLFRVDGFSVPVRAEVRHTSRLPEHPEWRVSGCSLQFTDETDRTALAGILSD
jgi:hypothetical protein